MNDIDIILDDFVSEFKLRLLQEENSEKVFFLDYAWRWFELSKKSKSLNTQFMYKNIISVHLSFLSGVPLSDIRQQHLQEAINRNIEHPRTCELIFITFKQIIQAAGRDHLISKNVIDDIFLGVSLPANPKKEKRPLSDRERQAVKNVKLPAMKECFLLLLYYTGIRKGEALALTGSDFDFDNLYLSISKNLVFLSNSGSFVKNSPKSSNGFRKIPIPAACAERIKPYVLSCGSNFLFHGQGAVLATKSFYRRFWDSIIFNLNVACGYNPNAKKNRTEKPIQGLTAHIFRHDYCTQLCYQVPDISTKMIAQLLGDSEKMVIEVYSHIVLEKEKVSGSIEKARTL